MNKDNLRLLKHFIKECKLALLTKTKGKKNPPYCNDHIINNNHFTNISRRDDYITKQIYNKLYNKELSKKDLILNIILNRLFSNRKTVEEFPVINLYVHTKEDIIKYYENLKNKNKKVYSGRFITIISFESFLDSLLESLDDLDLSSKESFCKSIIKVNYVGSFFAWQYCSDLVLFNLIPDDNKYVLLGNGSKAGLKILDTTFDELFNEIKDEIESYENLEHTLCEFFKYYRILTKSKDTTNKSKKSKFSFTFKKF